MTPETTSPDKLKAGDEVEITLKGVVAVVEPDGDVLIDDENKNRLFFPPSYLAGATILRHPAPPEVGDQITYGGREGRILAIATVDGCEKAWIDFGGGSDGPVWLKDVVRLEPAALSQAQGREP